MTRVTSPRLPLSRPAMTTTLSPFLILRIDIRFRYSTSGASETIFMNRSVRSSRVTGPKMRVPIGSSLLLSSTAALVSNGPRAVVAAHAVARAHHDGVVDLALLHASARGGILDADLDHVADMGIAALGASQHLDTHDSACAGVVGDVQHRLHLDHCCFSNLTRGARRRRDLRRRSRRTSAAASFGPRTGKTRGEDAWMRTSGQRRGNEHYDRLSHPMQAHTLRLNQASLRSTSLPSRSAG